MPPVIAAVAAISLTSVLTSIAISVVSAVVIGALSQALGGTDQPAAGVQPQTITLKQALVPWKVIYGRARVGGAWIYIHTTGNPVIGENSALMGAIVLACHQCAAIEKIFFGDEEVKLDASGNALGKWRNYVHIWKHLGTPGDPADANLIRWSDGGWTGNHRLAGRCYIAIDLASNDALFPSMPVISAQVKGKLLLDHRDGTTRWSDNAVLAVSDYLRSPDYGMGFSLSDFDLGNWNAETNSCDELVRSKQIEGSWRLPQDTFTAEVSKTWKANAVAHGGESGGVSTKTTPSAFTIASDTLGFDTGDRVMLSGNALPPPLATNTAYYVIRLADGNDYIFQALNVKRTPVIQLAASHADAVAHPPVPLTITGNGSGAIWMLDDMWLQGTDTKGLQTGHLVQVAKADANPLPSPLVEGTSYYWIDHGHEQLRYETSHQIVAYGHGMLASTLENAIAGIPLTLTSIGKGVYTVGKLYETRFTCNGVVDTSAKPSDIIGSMLSACGGKLVRSGDKWRLYTAVWRGVSGSLSEVDLRGPVKVNTLVSRRDLFNAVRGTYISPSNFDQPADFPPYPDPNRPDLDIFLAEDGERIWSQDIELPFTSTPSMAQRLAKILLMQMRLQISIIFPAKLTAFGITVGQVVNVSLPRMGWSNKAFEVVDWTFSLEAGGQGAPPVPGIDITLRETDPSVYEWENGAETTGWWVARPDLPSPLGVPTPVITSVIESRYVTVTGAGLSSGVTVAWNAVGNSASYQVAWIDGSGHQTIMNPQSEAQGTEAFIGPLTKGNYGVQVRAFNVFGVASAWSEPTTSFAVQGVVGPPPDLTNFRVVAVSGQAHATWDLSPDQDVISGGHIWLRWSPLTSGATWATAMGLSQQLAGAANEATVALKAGTYLVKAVDSAGNQSVNAATWVIADVDNGLALLVTTTESPTFPGTKTHLVVSGGNLQLDTTSANATVDDWADVDAVADWDGEGGLYADGEYDFDTVTDLGSIKTVRVELDMTTVAIGTSTLGDLSDARIQAEISTTTDDPTGSPTWTAWAPFMVNDVVAWGIRRRLLFSTNEPHYSIGVSSLVDRIYG